MYRTLEEVVKGSDSKCELYSREPDATLRNEALELTANMRKHKPAMA